MTRDEIEDKNPSDLSTNAWMKEICLQIALLNEKRAVAQQPIFDRTQMNKPQQARR